jgi:hypothetical protein
MAEEEEKPERKLPDFIVIEEEKVFREGGESSRESEDLLSSFQSISRAKYPISVRFIAFFGSILALILSLVAGAVLLLSFLLNLIVFFRVPTLYHYHQKIWKNFRRLIVFTLGAAVAVFSPPLGFGLIMLYFAFYADRMGNEFLKKMMH